MIAAAHAPAAQLQLSPERPSTRRSPKLHKSCRGKGRSPAVRASRPGGLDPGGGVAQLHVYERGLPPGGAKVAHGWGGGTQLPELTQRKYGGCSLSTTFRARRRAPSAPAQAPRRRALPAGCASSAVALPPTCAGPAYQLSATHRQRPGGYPKSFRGSPDPLGQLGVYLTETGLHLRADCKGRSVIAVKLPGRARSRRRSHPKGPAQSASPRSPGARRSRPFLRGRGRHRVGLAMAEGEVRGAPSPVLPAGTPEPPGLSAPWVSSCLSPRHSPRRLALGSSAGGGPSCSLAPQGLTIGGRRPIPSLAGPTGPNLYPRGLDPSDWRPRL